MKIYELSSDVENYKWMTWTKEEDFETLFQMRGQSMKTQWLRMVLEPIIEEEQDRYLPTGDYPCFTVPLISKTAAEILHPYIEKHVELLDVDIIGEDKSYSVLNVINILDCLDRDKSKLEWFDSGSGIMKIYEYAFNDMIDNEEISYIFRIKNYEKSIFVNEKLKETIERSGLKGFVFTDTSEKYTNPFAKLINKDIH